MAHPPLLVVTGPSRSGITALADAAAAALGWPHKDGSADLARISLVAGAARRQARRFAAVGWAPPPRLISAGMAEALLADLFAGGMAALVLRAAEVLPEPAVMPGLRHLLPLLPEARVILMRRDAVETMGSRLRSLPRMPFASHCLALAAAMEAGEDLLRAAPGQVMPVGREELRARPEHVVDRLASFCGLDPFTAGRLLAQLRTHRPAASGLDDTAFPLSLAEMGWSTPEKALFLEICGPAMARAGQPPEPLAESLRRAPLRLGELARDGALRLHGLEFSDPPEEPEGTVRLSAAGAGPAIALFPTIAPAGRRLLRLRMRGLRANAPAFRLRLELVGTLSREVLLVWEGDLPAGKVAEIEREVFAIPAMVDLVISLVGGHEEGSGLDIQDAMLMARQGPPQGRPG
ncbi:hypothetical protein D9599_03715 [Roseomonas sp. KE2513]|uniref:sulfotransferase n=1 Tax=Roseomonas sp. KE2513 TaxID=2479202 RepID=UPI0018E06417|nr:sulfotransferase [Roseomonas sp. KE2513]MBI0534676.1 hypothetical protein [Roseomonas sp. KE2513]